MKLFHFHKWKPIGAKQMTIDAPRILDGTPLIGEPYREWPETNVLWRCDCGKIKSENIKCHWTVDDLRGGVGDERKG